MRAAAAQVSCRFADAADVPRHDRALRSRLHLEAFEFVKAQRTACLLAGAWFALPSSSAGGGGGTRRTMSNNSLAAWRYCRLAPSKKAVHWADFAERSAGAPPPMDSLHERGAPCLLPPVCSPAQV